MITKFMRCDKWLHDALNGISHEIVWMDGWLAQHMLQGLPVDGGTTSTAKKLLSLAKIRRLTIHDRGEFATISSARLASTRSSKSRTSVSEYRAPCPRRGSLPSRFG